MERRLRTTPASSSSIRSLWPSGRATATGWRCCAEGDPRREAVIVSTARTPIGKAYRGAFNDTDPAVLSGHAVCEAVRRAGVDGEEVEDLVLGCAIQQGAQGYNIGRLTVASAGLPESVAGMTIDRKCGSGLMAIAIAARQVVEDGMQAVVA